MLARCSAFPILLGLSVASTLLLIRLGLPPQLALTIASVGLFAALAWLERKLPFRPSWNLPDGQLKNDLGHLLFGTSLGAALGNGLSEILFSTAGIWLASRWLDGQRLWPSQWPLWIQVALVFLIADLGRYLQHRLLHLVPWLWRFHALHHSGTQLNALKASRSHIVERITQQLFMFGPLILLGAGQDVVFWYIMPNSFLGLFAHSNADLYLGRFELVMMGPAAHRLHHSANVREGNTNFGSAIVLWDLLFGTFTNPCTTPAPERMGIPHDPTPPGFIAQVIDPFVVRAAPGEPQVW